MPGTCTYGCACPLDKMSAYDHLSHIYRLCVNHHGRNIHAIGSQISETAKNAMYSLSTAFPLPNINETYEVIRSGGPKAAGEFLFPPYLLGINSDVF